MAERCALARDWSNLMTDTITATRISNDNERLNAFPTYFGVRHMILAETAIYGALEQLSQEYAGGFWELFTLPNGGFYMAPAASSREKYHVVCPGNYFDGILSADAAGIVACLYGYCRLAETTREDRFVELYHRLREWACAHPEHDLILAAID